MVTRFLMQNFRVSTKQTLAFSMNQRILIFIG
jgi:hypothetical protein